MENPRGQARATLTTITRSMRDYEAFEKLAAELYSSVAYLPGFQSLSEGRLSIGSYTVHEFRFLKNGEGTDVYNRMVIFYSKDLAYVLDMMCPSNLRSENEPDFDAFVQGVEIMKSRRDLSPPGAPETFQ